MISDNNRCLYIFKVKLTNRCNYDMWQEAIYQREAVICTRKNGRCKFYSRLQMNKDANIN